MTLSGVGGEWGTDASSEPGLGARRRDKKGKGLLTAIVSFGFPMLAQLLYLALLFIFVHDAGSVSACCMLRGAQSHPWQVFDSHAGELGPQLFRHRHGMAGGMTMWAQACSGPWGTGHGHTSLPHGHTSSHAMSMHHVGCWLMTSWLQGLQCPVPAPSGRSGEGRPFLILAYPQPSALTGALPLTLCCPHFWCSTCTS